VEAEGVAWLRMPVVEARFTWRPDQILKAATSLSRAIVALRRTLVRLHADIVHANTLRAGIVTSLALIGTKKRAVWHVHDILPRHPLSWAIRVLAVLLRPAGIIAVSDATARAFCGPFSFKGKVTTIYNGTDLSRFPLKSAESLRLRSEMGIPEDAFLVCAVGQICARKGLLELVKAFEQIAARTPGMHLAIAGRVVFVHEEKYFKTLLRAVAEPGILERVHFTGELGDVSGLLQAADLLVLNSVEEPFGLVLVEAMSSGTPVLATRVGGIPEIVTDQQNGWLIEKADTPGLARKLLELSQNKSLLERVAQCARDETCARFSLEKFQSRLQEFYAELMPPQETIIGHAQTIGPCRD
jgi:L-malate glycosyltransferase